MYKIFAKDMLDEHNYKIQNYIQAPKLFYFCDAQTTHKCLVQDLQHLVLRIVWRKCC